ncbi:MAG TPA: hypothetical protein VGI20_06320 [Rhizomicrobium sp.]|jgi:DNA-binding transcriptional regulator YiaG
MYHYRESGLSNTWLSNGYEYVQTAAGQAICIRNPDGFQKAIAESLAARCKRLSGEEFRFLRKYLGLARGSLGEMFGLNERTITRWEESSGPPLWADRLIRAFYYDESSNPFPLTAIFEDGSGSGQRPTAKSKYRLVLKKASRGSWYEA